MMKRRSVIRQRPAFFAWQAERNVLPTLNNLLENREMGLDDGRLLLAASLREDFCFGNGALEPQRATVQ